MRRQQGAGKVAAIVLVVVIVLCGVFVAVHLARGGRAAVPTDASSVPLEDDYACVADGCGWTGHWSNAAAQAAPTGQPVKGTKPLHTCPKCGKFSVGLVMEGTLVDLGSQQYELPKK